MKMASGDFLSPVHYIIEMVRSTYGLIIYVSQVDCIDISNVYIVKSMSVYITTYKTPDQEVSICYFKPYPA